MDNKSDIKVITIIVGPVLTNCYIIIHRNEGIIIDPGGEENKIIKSLRENKVRVKMIINTHGHIDHISANKNIIDFTSAPLSVHSADELFLSFNWEQAAKELGIKVNTPEKADILLNDNDIVSIGEINFMVIHTPGHSPGSICLYTDKILMSGDTLFNGSVGRWDLPLADHDTIIESIKNKLLVLDNDTVVYPGHGPTTTIGYERKNNLYIK
jgi:glyoxylase-like metal-dependent hydrolase (beta-lactamase superfamily II)